MIKHKLLVITILCNILLSCGERINKRISMGMVEGWAEGNAMTLVTKEFLAQKDYHVVTHKAAPNLLLASMDNGDTDVFMNVWLPTTHGDKIAPFKNIFSAGVNYEDAKLGLVVPKYVDINSIEELNDKRDKFGSKIIGIERGSGMATYTDSVLLAYKLNYRQLNSSMIAMASELQKAVNEKRWVVVTAWQPHWLFGRFDLKFLEDPKKIYGDTEHIETFVRKDFDKDFPELYRYFQHAFFNEEIMTDLLTKMEAGKNKKETAKRWVEEHQELLHSWWGKE
ncbi:glycine betaine ABC transporter substrate-binding protein [Olivibacter domesticus]|uniref:Glycine betaine/proline transport system substrate-binding protein n=1 Tax=Olivibacter domesticus TaxID=407022 RepID=A0A1H7H3B1_OLID1|nr:glycine betaine ABC transporter substrate-binding protein [Olivibacter domesticus]SEK44257.1 glycine betaine/proline transport system substrate-binding protein [Olivibacter domesticus]